MCYGGWSFSLSTLIICRAWLTLKFWAMSHLVKYFTDLWGERWKIWAKSYLVDFFVNLRGLHHSSFCPKIVFGLREVNIFNINLDHLLGLAYPKSLSKIWLGWNCGWFWGSFLFCQNIGFWLWMHTKFHSKSESFIERG